MTAKSPSEDTLHSLELACEDDDTVLVRSKTLLSLIAAARELEQLKDAIGYLQDSGLLANGPLGIIKAARDAGWEPTNGR